MRVIIIGGGIAGVSVAYELARRADAPEVVLVEAEQQLAHHTTGRSAAQLVQNYGAAPVRALTRASVAFLHNPPEGLADAPLVTRREQLTIATTGQEAALAEKLADGGDAVERIDIAAAIAMFPLLDPEGLVDAIVEPESADIDVAGLHQAFVRGMRRHGGEIVTTARISAIERTTTGWDISWPDGSVGGDVIVNAAGAWGDGVAALAGVAPVGLEPKRRTAFMVASPVESKSARWPLTTDAVMSWYIKPDGPQFMCSPADEVPSEPCDARPEEIDVARTIELVNTATTLNIRSIGRAWAGLRTFTADRSMVIGPDPDEPAFVWLVGQGGTGIQTSPGAAQLAADLTMGADVGPELVAAGLELEGLLPDRLR